MSRPSRDDVLMGVASLFSERSTCSRAHVGVVIAREGRILSTGYNGAPAGMDHCRHDEGVRLAEGCRVAVHAEANALAYAARWGISLQGAELFSTMGPCLACAQLIINAGIVRVATGEDYRDEDGIKLLMAAGLEMKRYIGSIRYLVGYR